jgi:hypothetical protein
MVFFMVFSAAGRAKISDTMRSELMQSWYFPGAVQMPVFDPGWRYCRL